MGRIAALAAGLACLAGCGGSDGGSGGTPGDGGVIVRFEDRVAALDAAAARLADLDFTGTRPTAGFAVYRGHLGATADVAGAAPEMVVADVTMTARFGSGTIDGSFTNLASEGGAISGSGQFHGGTLGPAGIDSGVSGMLLRDGSAHAIGGTFRGDFLGAGAEGLGGGIEAVLTRDGAPSGRLDGEVWAER